MSVTDQQQARRHPVAALIIAAGLAVLAGVMLWDSARLADMGGYSGVGPASVPRVVAFCILGLSIWTLIEGFRGDFRHPEHQRVSPVLWVIGGLAAQLLLLHTAGFSIATGVLFAMVARAFGKRNLAMTLPIGIALSFVVWVIFSQLLVLHLPPGPLEHLLLPGG